MSKISKFERYVKYTGLSLFAPVLLSACATNKVELENNPLLVESLPEVNINNLAVNSGNDVFKVGDTAEVIFHDVDTLSSEYVVDRQGAIIFPLIGKVEVAGLSTADLQSTLVQRYGGQYLQNPSISVKLDAVTLGTVVVDGSVEKPGVFEIDKPVFLTEAIALAEGMTLDADRRNVYVVREISGERRILKVDINAVRQAEAEDVKVIPNDLIFVEDSTGRVAFREFLRVVPLLNTVSIIATR